MSGYTAAKTRRVVPGQTLAKVYEERAEDCARAADGTDDPLFRRLLLMLAAQWNSLRMKKLRARIPHQHRCNRRRKGDFFGFKFSSRSHPGNLVRNDFLR